MHLEVCAVYLIGYAQQVAVPLSLKCRPHAGPQRHILQPSTCRKIKPPEQMDWISDGSQGDRTPLQQSSPVSPSHEFFHFIATSKSSALSTTPCLLASLFSSNPWFMNSNHTLPHVLNYFAPLCFWQISLVKASRPG